MEGISESDVVSVGYTVVRGKGSIINIPSSSIVTNFTVSYTPASVQATPYSPSASVLPVVETQRPTFKWSASEGYTAFQLQIAKDEGFGEVVYDSDTNLLPVAHADGAAPRAYDYEVAAVSGGKVIGSKLVFSPGCYWADETDTGPVECAFAKSELPPDWRDSVAFTVTPRE